MFIKKKIRSEEEANWRLESESPNKSTPKYGSVSIGGKTYKTVKIGTQEWLAENLDLETDLSYKNPGHPEYGRYYEWDALDEIQKALPPGWRVPDNKDWQILVDAVGGNATAGVALKPKENRGRDDYGFNLQLGGARKNTDMYLDGSPVSESDHYEGVTNAGYYRSSSEYDGKHGYDWDFFRFNDGVRVDYSYKYLGLSVRCLRDSRETEEPKGESHQHTSRRIRTRSNEYLQRTARKVRLFHGQLQG